MSSKAFRDFDVYISAGALLTIVPSFKFKPSVFLDYSVQKTKKMQIDLNGNFIIYDLVWIGGSWRTSEQVAVGILQVQINPQIMVGYSYDYPVGRMNTYSKGSHEIVFRYEFRLQGKCGKPPIFLDYAESFKIHINIYNNFDPVNSCNIWPGSSLRGYANDIQPTKF